MRWTEMPRWRETSVMTLPRRCHPAARHRREPGMTGFDPGCGSHTSSRPLLRAVGAAARDVEEDLLQRGAVVARHDGLGRVVVLDAAALHDDDAVAQPLDLE